MTSCKSSRLSRPGCVLYHGDRHVIIQTGLKVNIFLAVPTSRQGGVGSPAQKCSRPNNQRQWAAVVRCALDARHSCQRLECVLSSFLSLGSFGQPAFVFPFSLFPFPLLIKTTEHTDSSVLLAAQMLFWVWSITFYFIIMFFSLMNHQALVLGSDL